MKKRVVIIHGWEGKPKDGWFPWLKNELEKRGCKVKVPAMPDTNTPKINSWVPFLQKHVGKPDESTFLIGHSMGCQTILRYLQKLPKDSKIGGIVLVAGFVNLTNLSPEETKIVKQWLTTPLKWDKIKTHTNKIVTIFSDNDNWVPLSDSKIFQSSLGAKIIIRKNMGHLSGDDGINKLPIVLNSLLEMM